MLKVNVCSSCLNWFLSGHTRAQYSFPAPLTDNRPASNWIHSVQLVSSSRSHASDSVSSDSHTNPHRPPRNQWLFSPVQAGTSPPTPRLSRGSKSAPPNHHLLPLNMACQMFLFESGNGVDLCYKGGGGGWCINGTAGKRGIPCSH